jgi:glycerate-2-kinase
MVTVQTARMRILNQGVLCGHGNTRGRKDLVTIMEAGLQAADPYQNTARLLRVQGDKLSVGSPDFEVSGSPKTGEELIDLSETGRILVIGAGKGVQRVAKAIEDTLGDRLTGGHVIDKHGAPIILDRIGVTLGAHPLPDEHCIAGSKRILEVCQDLAPNDLVFTIAANGISSLLTLPAPGLSLEDVRAVTYLMQIERGVPTQELNPIRNHLDVLKAGRISIALQPARAIHLVVYDPDGFGRYESGWSEFIHHNVWLHTLPDCSTYQDAIDILKKWGAWQAAPPAVRQHLLQADPAFDTVKPAQFEQTRFRVFGLMPRKLGFLPTAQQKARELGYSPHTLCSRLETEASYTGELVAAIACSIEHEGAPFQPPCALFTWGEMVVTVGEEKGIGGRNQEYALSAALKIAGSQQIVMGAVDTDGADGPGAQFSELGQNYPTLAGGIVDGYTVSEARMAGLDILGELRRHNTTPALLRLGSGIQASYSISLSDIGLTLIMGRS